MDILKSGLEALHRLGLLILSEVIQTDTLFQGRVSAGDKAMVFSYSDKATLAAVSPGEAIVAKKISEIGALRVLVSAFSIGTGEFTDHALYPEAGLEKTLKSTVLYPVQCSDVGVIYQDHQGGRYVHQGEDHMVSLAAYRGYLVSGHDHLFALTADLVPLQSTREIKSEVNSMVSAEEARMLASARYPLPEITYDGDFMVPLLSGKAPQVLELGEKKYLSSDLELASKVRGMAWDLLTSGTVQGRLNIQSSLKELEPEQIFLASEQEGNKKTTGVVFSSKGGYSVYSLKAPLENLDGAVTLTGDKVKEFLKQSVSLLRKAPVADDVLRIVSGALYDIKVMKVDGNGLVTCSVFDGADVSVKPMKAVLASLGLDADYEKFNRVRFVDFGRGRLKTPVFSKQDDATRTMQDMENAKWELTDGTGKVHHYEGSKESAKRHLGRMAPGPKKAMRVLEKLPQGYVPQAYENYDEEVPPGDPEENRWAGDADFEEEEEGLDDTPSEDDGFMSPAGPLGGKTQLSIDGKAIGTFGSEDEAFVAFRDWCEKNQFWPNLWVVDDHGGTRPYDMLGGTGLTSGFAGFEPPNDLDRARVEWVKARRDKIDPVSRWYQSGDPKTPDDAFDALKREELAEDDYFKHRHLVKPAASRFPKPTSQALGRKPRTGAYEEEAPEEFLPQSFNPGEYGEEDDNLAFDVAGALFQYLQTHHGGQNTEEYAALSALQVDPIKFQPGAGGFDPDDEEVRAYAERTGEHQVELMLYEDFVNDPQAWKDAYQWLLNYCSKEEPVDEPGEYANQAAPQQERMGGGPTRKTILAYIDKNWDKLRTFFEELTRKGIKDRESQVAALLQRVPALGPEGAAEVYYQYHVAHQSFARGMKRDMSSGDLKQAARKMAVNKLKREGLLQDDPEYQARYKEEAAKALASLEKKNQPLSQAQKAAEKQGFFPR